ncbi:hypothetical protein HMPREF9104_02219, partial [Lentilactobacillus kisonensis F0435]
RGAYVEVSALWSDPNLCSIEHLPSSFRNFVNGAYAQIPALCSCPKISERIQLLHY